MRKYCIYILWVISLFFDFKLYAQSIDTIYLKGKEQFEIGNYVKALDYYFKALKISESINDKSHASIQYCNIAIVYSKSNDLQKTKSYFT